MVRPGFRSAIYSALENKTIIFLTQDAIGTIGFTGIAFVGQDPTDQWIANTIAPQPDGCPPLGSFVFGGQGLGRSKLCSVVQRLAARMADLPWNLRKHGLTVQVSGFRVKRRRTIPFCVEVEWRGGAPKIDGWMRLPRTRQQGSIFAQIGDGWPIARTGKAVADYAAATGRRDVEAIREAAMAAIRERAKETITVGTDLMTVVIRNPTVSREVIWKFEPIEVHDAAFVGPDIDLKFQAIYSPWIITPGSVHCPAVGTGAFDVCWGGFTFRCGNDRRAVPMKGRGNLAAVYHQRRTGPPRPKL